MLQDVCKSFGGKVAVQDLSLTIAEGQVYGLLGLNGAGKSTTIRMILDILQPDGGSIQWRGQPHAPGLRGRVGYLPEERGLYPNMKVLAQLVMFGRLHGLEKGQALAAAKQWLERFGVPQYAQSRVSELSKGNQQKIQFIAAILHNPELIVLDEPFSGLDPVNTELFKAVFRELVQARKTVLFSSHRLDHVEELSDSVAIIHRSRIVLNGSVSSILAAEAPRFVRIGAEPAAIRAYLPAGTPVEEARGLTTIALTSCNPSALLQSLLASGANVTHYELVRPSLTDIFLREVGETA